MSTVVLGIDPGSYSAGVALVSEDAEVLWTRAWQSSIKDRTARLYSLWGWLYNYIREATLMTAQDVVVIACEDPWVRYAKTVKALSECKGLAMGCFFLLRENYWEAAIDLEMHWMDIAPLQGKVALTGSGKASKERMVQAVLAQFGLEVSEDEADAVGIALAALGKLKEERLKEEEDG